MQRQEQDYPCPQARPTLQLEAISDEAGQIPRPENNNNKNPGRQQKHKGQQSKNLTVKQIKAQSTLEELSCGESDLKPTIKLDPSAWPILGFQQIDADVHETFPERETESRTFWNSACNVKEMTEAI